MKAPLILSALFCALVLGAEAQVRYGAPDDFAPLVNGPIHALHVQSDGMLVIAGAFSEVNGVVRNGIARLTPEGALDATFAAHGGADGPIHHLAYRPAYAGNSLAEAYFIAGEFTRVDTVTTNRLAKLSAADGAPDSTFDIGSGPDGVVSCLGADLEGEDRLYVGGEFQHINGNPVPYFAVLTDNGQLMPEVDFSKFAPNAPVRSMAVSRSDLALGGEFTSLGNIAASHLAIIDIGSGDFEVLDSSPSLDGSITHMAFNDPTGSSPLLYVLGSFTSVDNEYRGGFARFDMQFPSANLSASALATTGGPATSLLAYPGRLALAGSFTHVQGLAARTLALLLPAGEFDAVEQPIIPLHPDFESGSGTVGTVHAMAVTNGERLYLAGEFSEVDGLPRSNLARLHGSWLALPPEATGAPLASPADPNAIALLWDRAERADRYRVDLRLADEEDWIRAGVTSSPHFLATGLQADTAYEFRIVPENYNGVAAPSPVIESKTYAEPWTGAGTVDRPFTDRFAHTNFSRAMAELADGRTILAGEFARLEGAQSQHLVMLLPDGSFDPSFHPGTGPDSDILDLAVQPDGTILLGGLFNKYDGTVMPGICRIQSDGSLDSSFQSPLVSEPNTVWELFLQKSGNIVITGYFNEVEGVGSKNLAILLPNGSLSPAYQPDPLGDFVRDIVGLSDDSFLLRGPTSYRGIAVDEYFRVLKDGSLDPDWPLLSLRSGITWRAVVDAIGRIYVVGRFSYELDGQIYYNALRLLPDGSIDPSFRPPGDSSSNSLTIMGAGLSLDGKLIIVGPYKRLGSVVVPGVVRLNEGGSMDETFRSPEFFGRFTEPEPEFYLSLAQVFTDSNNHITLVGERQAGPAFADSGFIRLLGEQPASLPAPGTPEATAASSSAITIRWLQSPAAFGTTVERSEDGVTWELLATVPAPRATYEDSTAQPDQEYHYRLRAVAGSTQSPALTVSATTWTLFQQWATEEGFDADTPSATIPPGGSSSLLLTYALGLRPLDSFNEALVISRSGDRLAAVYRRPRAELVYAVQQSSDGINWSSAGVDQGPSGGIGFASVPIQANGSTSTLLRLEVREP